MSEAIVEAIRLLESAKALPTDDAKATVNQAIDLLMRALDNERGLDKDPQT